MNVVLPALAGSFAAALASLLGVVLVQLRPAWMRASALPLAAFAGGVILGAAFLHLLPEAMERAPSAHTWALIAFFALYLLETHVVPHSHHEHDHHSHAHHAHDHTAVPSEAHRAHVHTPAGSAAPITTIATLAFGLHAGFDGVALGVGFAPSVELGSPATLGVLAHKVPEGIALASLLLRGGMRPRRALAVAAMIAMLTPLGTALSLAFLDEGIAPEAMGRLLALVAGAFVYVATTDLLPEVAHHPRLSRTALVVLGVVVSLAFQQIFG